MRACRYHVHRTDPALVIEDVAVPKPAPGEVQVRVEYAGLNPVDWKLASGSFRFLVKGGLPRIPGSDYTGHVVAVGDGVDGWAAGEPVLGFVDPFARAMGTFAEYVNVPVEFLYRRPGAVDPRVAGAVPCAGLKAVVMCSLTRVGPGRRVLVNGASGGVGHLAVQVAKLRGADVTATATAGRHDWLGSLGADRCIDYRRDPVARWPGGYDAVLDCVPNLPRSTHSRLLARGGGYASTLPDAWTYTVDPLLNRLGRRHRHAVMLRPDAAAYDELLAALAAGRLRCEIAGEYPLAEVTRAVEASRTGRVAGKLVIRVA
jgi:NADPH:quinone reductase-like Zn-dependent oxidoreductase